MVAGITDRLWSLHRFPQPVEQPRLLAELGEEVLPLIRRQVRRGRGHQVFVIPLGVQPGAPVDSHHQEEAVAVRAEVVHGHHMRIAQPRGGLRFPPENDCYQVIGIAETAMFDALLEGRTPRINGDDYPTPDGTCVRDYIHVVDLADAGRYVAAVHVQAEQRFQAVAGALRLGAEGAVRLPPRRDVRQVLPGDAELVRVVVVAGRDGDVGERPSGPPPLYCAVAGRRFVETAANQRASSSTC